ncbi:kinetochore protein Spc25-like [Scleropages formosus]|uniref:Kinetochore protein SPC25 n=1 Tax=Scleropages formosus TaxID=113540 RepID=A0A0P7XDT5_SCLFO|nr:kinetochore protein Spc25 [Scleropages formosus]XP_018597003.1 kinetochore protein Spc25 [Scleropages formosus]KPP73476.1 kinetochore protein Spc25-like [Scleropages formosus]
MACVKDPNVVENFSNTLEDIRNKLLVQAIGDMVDTEAALCQTHREHLQSMKETCLKKSKEDDNMFETIQLLKRDLEQKYVLMKEVKDTIPEVLSEIEDKENQKDVMIKKIGRMKEEQMKKKELIISQNKANKDKLKNLNKAKQMFQDWLGLEIRKIHGEKLQFIFRSIDSKDPESVYTFILQISEEGLYQVVSCDPPLKCMAQLEKRLQETKNFSAFLANVRKEFAVLLKN